jgi:hypothetical protein
VYAYLHAVTIAEELESPECLEWLKESKKLATDADIDSAFSGKNFLLKQNSITPLKQMGFLKHGFMLSFFHLLLFHKLPCNEEKINQFYGLSIRQTI